MTSLSGCSIRATRWGKVTVMGANAQTTVQKFLSGAVLTAEQQNFSAATGVPVFATTVTRDAAFGGANKVLAEGQTCYLEDANVVQYYDGAAWQAVSGFAQTTAIFNETQASSTQGGTPTANAWTKSVLNTTNVNNISGVSIAASVITLPAGTYLCTFARPAVECTQLRARLQNTSDATTAVLGQNAYIGNGVGAQIIGIGEGVFTIAGTKSFELQYYLRNVKATDGLGVGLNVGGISEVYSQINITKTA